MDQRLRQVDAHAAHAGVIAPTAGRLEVTGRVLPLLEVGAGFHGELTGRENVVLFGTVLGLSKREIAAGIPAIAEFGGIDEAHMDTPIKRYSTGMQSRLSFAVAMTFAADIYIFDEVMAVVDDNSGASRRTRSASSTVRGARSYSSATTSIRSARYVIEASGSTAAG